MWTFDGPQRLKPIPAFSSSDIIMKDLVLSKMSQLLDGFS